MSKGMRKSSRTSRVRRHRGTRQKASSPPAAQSGVSLEGLEPRLLLSVNPLLANGGVPPGLRALVDGPQRPTIDLQNSDDTGLSDMDNVTIGDLFQGPGKVDVRITSDPGTTVDIKDGNTVIVTVPMGAAGETFVSLDFNALAALTGFPAEGPHPLSAEAIDGDDIRNQSEQLLVTIDFTAPAASTPTLLPSSDTGTPGDNITSINQPAFLGQAEPNATVWLLVDGAPVGRGVSDASGYWEITAEPLADGTYDITTTVEDLAGNVSLASAPLQVTIDTGAPQRPTIDLLNADDTGASDMDNVTRGGVQQPGNLRFVLTAEVGSTVVVKDGNTVIDTFISTGSDVRTLILAEGTHLLSAEATSEPPGNVSVQSEELVVTVDFTAPAPSDPALAATSDTGVAGDNTTNLNQPAFVGTAEANALIRVFADGVLVGQGVVNSDESDGDATNGLGTWEVTVEPLSDGVHNITTEVEDLAGNISNESAPLEVTIETSSPQRPTIDLENADDTGASDMDNVTIGDPVQGAGIVDVRITSDPGTTVDIKDGNTVIHTVLVGVSGEALVTLDFNALAGVTGFPAEGPHALSAEAYDDAGNATQSEQLLVTIDFTAPNPATVSLAPFSNSGSLSDNTTNVMQPAFVGLAEANAKIRVFADDGVNGPVLVGEGVVNSDESDGDATNGLGTWEVTVEPLADGVYTITTEVEDLAGNISGSSDPFEITIDTSLPQRPTIDLVDDDDTGISSLDNVTMGDPARGPGIVDVRITSDPGTMVDIKDGNTVIASVAVGVTGEAFVTLNFNALAGVTGFPAEGPHALSAEAFDAAGNFTQSEQLLVTIDFTIPAAPSIALLAASDSLPLGDGITVVSEPAFAGTGEPNSLVRLYANGELVGQSVVTSGGQWEITSEPLVDDNYIFTVELEDLAGNVSPLSDGLALTIAVDYGFYLDPITGAVIFNGEDGVADVVTVSLNPAGTDVVIDWAQPSRGLSGSASFPLADTPAFTFIAFGGNDTLIVVNDNGLVSLPDGIFYDGGSGNDMLRLVGSTAVDSVTYNVGPDPNSGSIIHVLGDDTQKVIFTNLEPVIDIVAGPLVVNGTPASNVINYDVGPNSGTNDAGGFATALIAVDNFESLEFGNKDSLTVNGLSGNDRIDLNNAPNPPELAAVVLNGGGGNDTLIGSAGDDLLVGGRGNDLLQGLDGNDVLLGEEGDDVLEGGAGDDSLDGGVGADNLDGGDGFDSAFFGATDSPDEVFMDAGQVVVNGTVNTIANVEHVTLETAGGEDTVTVDAGEGFPELVSVFTGEDDDDIHVNLANPAPATVIEVDGGPHEAGDSATVQGATGDDQFTIYGFTNVFGAATVILTDIENPTVLEGRRIDTDRSTVEIRKFDFVDEDGNDTTVIMSGPGAVDVFRNIFNGRAADIYTMSLDHTSASRTRLSVNVRRKVGTDNETSIGSIVGVGTGARAITAKRSDLVGEGIYLSDTVGSLKLDDIADGANIMLGGESGQKVRLTADRVGAVDLITGAIVQTIRVSSWACGTIQGSVLGSIAARAGSFGADLINQRQDRRGFGLKSLSVKNGDLNTNITSDRINSVKVTNGDAWLTATVTTDAVTLDGATAFNSLSVRGGDLLGAYVNLETGTLFKKMKVSGSRGVGGNIFGEVSVTGGSLGATSVSGDVIISGWNVAENMGKTTVKGTVRALGSSPASVRSGGSMGKTTVGAVEHVDFLAGIDPWVARKASSPGDFDPTAAIESFRIKGLRIPRGSPIPRFMVDSNISAATLGTFKLLNVDFADSALFALDQGGAEIEKIVHKDKVDPTLNFVYPPRPGDLYAGPPDFINVL